MKTREIKFRGYDPYETNKLTGKRGIWMTEVNFDAPFAGMIMIPAYGDRYIWQQFTGLVDKNGKEIFEGDILSVTHTDPEFNITTTRISKVIWYHQGAFWQEYPNWLRTCSGVDDGKPVRGWIQPEESEVIGNIFENPELLK